MFFAGETKIFYTEEGKIPSKEKSGMWITTENPAIIFEDTEVGRLKKEIWGASEEEIDAILRNYEVPSPQGTGKGGKLRSTNYSQEAY